MAKHTNGNSRTPIDPQEYVHIVGQTFLKKELQPLLAIGTRTWHRWALGRLGCPHPMAAARLQKVIHELGITSMQALANHAQEIGNFKGLGVTAYWTVLAILREAGWDVKEVHKEDVSYETVKRRALKIQARERPRLRKRRAGPPSEATDQP